MAKSPHRTRTRGRNATLSNFEMAFYEGMWDDSLQMPKPWIFGLVFAVHFVAVFILIKSNALTYRPQKPIPVEIIYEEPPTTPIEPKPIVPEPPKPILYKKPVEKPIEKLETKPKDFEIVKAILKPEIQKIEKNEKLSKLEPPPIPKPDETKEEKSLPQKQKLLDIEKMMQDLKPAIKGPDIATDDLGNSADKSKIVSKNPNSVLLDEPKSKDHGIALKDLKLDTKISPSSNAINASKLDQPKEYSKPAPIASNNKLDFKPNEILDNSKKLDEKQNAAFNKFAQDELLRQKQLEELEKQKQKPIQGGNAPISPNGELPKPSGVTSVSPGALPLGGPPVNGQKPSQSIGDPAQASGSLPKKPASYGKGSKNLFEEGEDNTAIGKVGRAIDCAKLGQKERSEKCPNWQPLESGAKKDIAPKPPKGAIPAKPGNKDPMPACPKDHPNGNLGMPCLPQNKEPKIKF